MKEKIKKFLEDHEVLCETVLGLMLLFGTGAGAYKIGEKTGQVKASCEIACINAEEELFQCVKSYTEGYAVGFKDGFTGKEEQK